MRLVKTLVLGILLAAAGSGLYAQTQTTPARNLRQGATPKPRRPKALRQKPSCQEGGESAPSSKPARARGNESGAAGSLRIPDEPARCRRRRTRQICRRAKQDFKWHRCGWTAS